MTVDWKVVLLFVRRIEVPGVGSDGKPESKMVEMPFVKMSPADPKDQGDMFFGVPGGKVVYTPEKADIRETPNGTMVKHVVIAAGALVESITAANGVVYKIGDVVPLDLTPIG